MMNEWENLNVDKPSVVLELPVVKEEDETKPKSEFNEHADVHHDVVLPVKHSD